jgi:PAS domain S-box-containing protein
MVCFGGAGRGERVGMDFFATAVRGGRIHAAWLLLDVESRIGVVARDIRLADCAFVFHDSLHAAVVCAQAAGFAIQLDVRAVWGVHRGVRATHVMAVWNLWHAQYWLAGGLKAVTSMATAILLARLVPRALELPDIGEWAQANVALESEIHERRELEIDLRISESRFREQADLLDLTYDAVIVRNLRKEITYWNHGAEELYGWRAEETLRTVTHELLQTVFPKELAEIEAETRERGSWEGELTHRRRDDALVTVSSRWVLRSDAEGIPSGILESNRDISSKRDAQESRRQSEERTGLNEIRFRLLIDAVKDYAIIRLDADGLVTSWNSGAQRLKGYSAEEIVGQHVGRLYLREDIERGQLEEELRQAAAEGHVEDEG